MNFNIFATIWLAEVKFTADRLDSIGRNGSRSSYTTYGPLVIGWLADLSSGGNPPFACPLIYPHPQFGRSVIYGGTFRVAGVCQPLKVRGSDNLQQWGSRRPQL